MASNVPPRVIKRTGVVAEYNGMYWGIQYADGHATEEGYGPIENAKIGRASFCTKPTDMTYKDSHYATKLAPATLRPITITTTYEVG